MLITLQESISIFVTKPEYGDNHFICQPLLNNNNLKHPTRIKNVVFRQDCFGLPPNIKLNVNQLYKLNVFISQGEYKRQLLENFNHVINDDDNSYIFLKYFLGKIYGNSNTHKHLPPVLNKKKIPYGSHFLNLNPQDQKDTGEPS